MKKIILSILCIVSTMNACRGYFFALGLHSLLDSFIANIHYNESGVWT